MCIGVCTIAVQLVHRWFPIILAETLILNLLDFKPAGAAPISYGLTFTVFRERQ